jgi:phage gpG-like protein
MLRMSVRPRGLKEWIARLEGAKDRASAAAATALGAKLGDLVLYIRSEKLSGQVLNRRTGALSDSIGSEVTSTTFPVRGAVFSRGVKYAAIHEYGGTTAPHVIMAKNAQALAFMMDGKMVFRRMVNHPGSVMPERSYMRSSVAENLNEITFAVRSAIIGALTQ